MQMRGSEERTEHITEYISHSPTAISIPYPHIRLFAPSILRQRVSERPDNLISFVDRSDWRLLQAATRTPFRSSSVCAYRFALL